MNRTAPVQPLFPPLVLGIWVLAGMGCANRGEPRDLMMEEARSRPIERPVAMQGEGAFLDGRLHALVTISRGFDRVGSSRDSEGPRRRYNDYGDIDRRRDEGSGFSQVYRVSHEYSEKDRKEMIEDYIRQAKARRAAGSPMPPVTLRVQFENRGTEPVELEVTEVNSDLGNFAVRPPQLTIAPGETGTLEPMISQLGVMSDEIPLKLAVRAGGARESQVVTIKNILGDAVRKDFDSQP